MKSRDGASSAKRTSTTHTPGQSLFSDPFAKTGELFQSLRNHACAGQIKQHTDLSCTLEEAVYVLLRENAKLRAQANSADQSRSEALPAQKPKPAKQLPVM